MITSATDLVTSRDKTRAGFISLALEKNYLAVPYIAEARSLKVLSSAASTPSELLSIPSLRTGLLTASGLSDKALNYLTEPDKDLAIKGLIEEFLEPAGAEFPDELVYRYLLIKGDALGGQARNLTGALGERKFLRALLSVLNLLGVPYVWKDCQTKCWIEKSGNDADIEKRIKGLFWQIGNKQRLLLMNINVPMVGKNVDLCLFDGNIEDIRKPKKSKGWKSITGKSERYIALGELKGGIDPAGADEHWKTANSALVRIRQGFNKLSLTPHTFFIGAAIENSMASEIFDQLQERELTTAANLTIDEQLVFICDWLVNL